MLGILGLVLLSAIAYALFRLFNRRPNAQVSSIDSKIPEEIPNSCRLCKYFEGANLSDVHQGQCHFYNIDRSPNLNCYVYELVDQGHISRERAYQAISGNDEPGLGIQKVAALKSGIIGIFIGGLLGFLRRPSFPLIGQLSFGDVITRGSNLSDQFLVRFAQESFNYLVFGAIIGGIAGVALSYFVSKRQDFSNQPSTKSQPLDARVNDGVAENIKKLAELRDSGILTEDEF